MSKCPYCTLVVVLLYPTRVTRGKLIRWNSKVALRSPNDNVLCCLFICTSPLPTWTFYCKLPISVLSWPALRFGPTWTVYNIVPARCDFLGPTHKPAGRAPILAENALTFSPPSTVIPDKPAETVSRVAVLPLRNARWSSEDAVLGDQQPGPDAHTSARYHCTHVIFDWCPRVSDTRT